MIIVQSPYEELKEKYDALLEQHRILQDQYSAAKFGGPSK